MTTFNDLWLNEPILKALTKEGYQNPTPIQEQSIPLILQWNDLFGCAQTWTGKTAAFSIPLIQLIAGSKTDSGKETKIKALVLTPTRELAIQIWESFASYGKFAWLKHTVIFWWVGQWNQVKDVRNWVDIVVATPGRLLDLMNQKLISLAFLQFLVLDEADRMLDMWFIHDVKKIISKVPNKRQTLLFSATMPKSIMDLAQSILKNPLTVEVTPVSSTVETVSQSLYHVDKDHKKDLLLHLLQEKNITRAIVFTKTKHGADKVAKFLNQSDVKASAIHGNKSQSARQNALNDFKNSKIRILVATDIAARWIDIDELSHVFVYDIPHEPETYVHRIWRTGRAWAEWCSIMFCDQEEKKYLNQIIKLINVEIELVKEHPFKPTWFTASKVEHQRAPRPPRQDSGSKRPSRPQRNDWGSNKPSWSNNKFRSR